MRPSVRILVLLLWTLSTGANVIADEKYREEIEAGGRSGWPI